MTLLCYDDIIALHKGCMHYVRLGVFSPVGTGGMPPIHSNIMDRTVYANAISIAAESHNPEQAPTTAVPTYTVYVHNYLYTGLKGRAWRLNSFFLYPDSTHIRISAGFMHCKHRELKTISYHNTLLIYS